MISKLASGPGRPSVIASALAVLGLVLGTFATRRAQAATTSPTFKFSSNTDYLNRAVINDRGITEVAQLKAFIGWTKAASPGVKVSLHDYEWTNSHGRTRLAWNNLGAHAARPDNTKSWVVELPSQT